MKRYNPYCVEDVVKKHNISQNDAIVKIQELKQRTTITLENLIRKHGEEEGIKRFDAFRKKSAHTKEKYMDKYGKDWKEHWSKYLASKSCGLAKFIERHGPEQGKILYEKYQAKKSFSSSLKGYIQKYGEENGLQKYQEIQKKKDASTVSHFIDKYGEEIGFVKYEEHNCKKDSSSLLYFVDKYGDIEGKIKYDEKRMKCSPIFCAIKKEYGEETAKQAYLEHKEKNFDVVSQSFELIAKHKTNIKSKKLSKGPVSKESNSFFFTLEKAIGRKLKYGNKSQELQLLNIDTYRYFCYDCLDETSNTIIEFHGVTWHPKEGELSWTNPFGVDYQTKREKDCKKRELAESKGYKYFVVYSDEVKTVDAKQTKINFLKEMIDANRNQD